LVLFVFLGQFVLHFVPVPDSDDVSIAMETLFSAVPRIAVASFTAYAIAQSLDIWLYHYIREKTTERLLWVRNNGSTLVSQLVDSVVFFSLAFAGTVPLNVLIKIIFTGYLLKILVALMDTPLIYLSYIVKGLPIPKKSAILKPQPD
jgi:queuosine precursor transporter